MAKDASALCNKLSTVHKGVWGRPSPTLGGCSANEVSAEGGLAPLAEVRCDSPKLITQRTSTVYWIDRNNYIPDEELNFTAWFAQIGSEHNTFEVEKIDSDHTKISMNQFADLGIIF